ncbi:MAG: radical SAM protein [Limisphaerales bacterium]
MEAITDIQRGLRAFSLTLMVNHACNLRCSYCYTGSKFNRRMLPGMGDQAIRRALASIRNGGRLDLGFFGGEPMMEAKRIREWIGYAKAVAAGRGIRVIPGLTTNGTIRNPQADDLLFGGELEVSISCDGAPETHDRHRIGLDGAGSFSKVRDTIEALVAVEADFQTITVVRPDTAAKLPDNLKFLHSLGVRRMVVSLDLWTQWKRQDAARLLEGIAAAGRFWRERLPCVSVNCFDLKLAAIVGAPVAEDVTVCGYGHGVIAVSPAGNLYPCERVIADDQPGNPARLPGRVHEGEDFLQFQPAGERNAAACSNCAIRDACGTSCRCSNFVRTGDVGRPDGLLCLFDKACYQEALKAITEPSNRNDEHERTRRDTRPVRRADCC